MYDKLEGELSSLNKFHAHSRDTKNERDHGMILIYIFDRREIKRIRPSNNITFIWIIIIISFTRE